MFVIRCHKIRPEFGEKIAGILPQVTTKDPFPLSYPVGLFCLAHRLSGNDSLTGMSDSWFFKKGQYTPGHGSRQHNDRTALLPALDCSTLDHNRKSRHLRCMGNCGDAWPSRVLLTVDSRHVDEVGDEERATVDTGATLYGESSLLCDLD